MSTKTTLEDRQRRRRERIKKASRKSRGVVLLIIVSLLVLFVLLGVTYAVLASKYRDTAKVSGRLEIYRDNPRIELDRIFGDLLRDPAIQFSGNRALPYDPSKASAAGGIGNPSALAGHSLLRDLYGIHASGYADIVAMRTVIAHAGSTSPSAGTVQNLPIIPSMEGNDEFIRVAFDNLTNMLGDSIALASDVPNAYSGCWVHFMSGPFAGESARIRAFEPHNVYADNNDQNPGQALLIDSVSYSGRQLFDANQPIAQRPLNLVGSRIMVSGKAFGGTGHGWQPGNYEKTTPLSDPQSGRTYTTAAAAPIPETEQDPIGKVAGIQQADGMHRSQDPARFGAMFPPTTTSPREIRQARRAMENLVALMPHFSKYENAARSVPLAMSVGIRNPERDAGRNPYSVMEDVGRFAVQVPPADPANNIFPTFAPLNPAQGGENEPWDAYDPQNMFLSMMIELATGGTYVGPSFHQGPLVNYWFNRMIMPVYDSNGNFDPANSGVLCTVGDPTGANPNRALQVAAFLFPFGTNGMFDAFDEQTYFNTNGPNRWRLQYVESITRRIIFRPMAAMHPNFTGSNPIVVDPAGLVRSGFATTDSYNILVGGNVNYANLLMAQLINSFAVGSGAPFNQPQNGFDVDNDGEGNRDSVWIDPGLPIVTMADGRRYKRLAAILVKDLDNRLNVNAVGNVAQVGDPYLAAAAGGSNFQINSPIAADFFANVNLTRGIGVGPADINMAEGLFGGNTSVLQAIIRARYMNVNETQYLGTQPGLGNVATNTLAAYGGFRTTLTNPLPINNVASDQFPDYETIRKLVGPSIQVSPPLHRSTLAGYTLMGDVGFAPITPLDVWGRGTYYLDKFGKPIPFHFGYNAGTDNIFNSTYEMDPYGNSPGDAPFGLVDLERLLRGADLDVASGNTRLSQVLGGFGNNANVRNSLTTLSSHIPALSFGAPAWLKRQWTHAVADNIQAGNTTHAIGSARLQQLLTSASVVELAKARMPAIPSVRPGVPYAPATPPAAVPNWFVAHPNATDFPNAVLGVPATHEWQYAGNAGSVEQASLYGWDPGLYYETVSYDDQLRRMLPWEILHGEKLNLNRYFEANAPTFDGTVAGIGTAYTQQNDVPDVRGYYRPNRIPANGFINTTQIYLSQRQLLARHLYCLMSLVIDPNCAEVLFQDEIQYRAQVHAATQGGNYFAGLSQARWAAREMLARKIAQWAVNAVDMMDSDGVMTAFEYDVNPWNGWTVDGILGTEDDKDYIRFPERRLVWGVEDPDLLITESLNMHDRRIMDLPKGRLRVHPAPPPPNSRDVDLDQAAIPQGSTFLELWCPRPLLVKPNQTDTRDPEQFFNVFPQELYTGTQLDLARTSPQPLSGNGGNIRYPIWRVAISEHIPADNGTRQDYLPEYNLWTPLAPNNGTVPLVRPSYSLEPSYDTDNPSGTHVNWEYVATSPFFGFYDTLNNQVVPSSPWVRDGMPGLFVARSSPYMAGYTASNNNRWRFRIGLERFAYFTQVAPNLAFRHIDLNDASIADTSRTFAAARPSVLLSPQQFLVMGPRASTPFGGIIGDPVDPNNPTASVNVFENWSPNRIDLVQNGGNDQVRTFDHNGTRRTPPIGNSNLEIAPTVAVICQRFQTDANNDPLLVNGGYAGLSVTEPLQISAGAQYYKSPPAANAPNRPEGFYGAVTPIDQNDEMDIPSTPLEYIEGPTDGRTTPIHELEKDPANPDYGGPMQRSGTYDNRRIAFLQRLADPRAPWHRDHNPYMTVDHHTMDITTFSGLISTRRTVTASAPADANQGAQGNVAIDTLGPPDGSGNPSFVNDNAFGGDLWTDPMNPIAPPTGVRCATITRERGFREPGWSFEQIQQNGAANNWRTLNAWSPLTFSTSYGWEASYGYTSHSLYFNGLRTSPSNSAGSDIAWNQGVVPTNPLNDPLRATLPNTGMQTVPQADPNAYPMRLGGANDWRQRPDYSQTVWEQGTKGQPVISIYSYPLDAPNSGSLASGSFLPAMSNTLGYLNRSLGRRQLSANGYVGFSDQPAPWNGFHNRMLANPMELLTVPASPASRWGMDFSIASLNLNGTQQLPLNGVGSPYSANMKTTAQQTQTAWGATGHFPSLLNMLWSSADTDVFGTNDNPTIGPQFNNAGVVLQTLNGPNQKRADFVRIFDLIDTPSRFRGTEEYFDEATPIAYTTGNAFNNNTVPGARSYRYPYNRASKMREPGKINLNTIYQREVFESLVGRYSARGQNIDGNGWFKFLVARRGIPLSDTNNNNALNHGPGLATNVQENGNFITQAMCTNTAYPSLLNNPFRPASAADLMPAPVYADRQEAANGNSVLRHNLENRNRAPVDVTILRKDLTTGVTNEQMLFSFQGGIGTRAQAIDQNANPYFRFQGPEQLANLVSGTSNVFAIWITIGYFEVEPNYVNRTLGATPTTNPPSGFLTTAQVLQAANGQPLPAFLAQNPGITIEYDVNHPDGVRLGAELGSDDGTFTRHRAFYVVDRSIPVAFDPGKEYNTDRCVLLKRFIE